MNGQSNPLGMSARNRLRLAAPPPPAREEGEVDWLQLVRLVRRRFWGIVLVAALLTLAAVPAILSIPPEYVARTRVILSQPLSSALNDPTEPGVETLDVNAELERLSSRSTAEAVIAELDLLAERDFQPPPARPGLRERLGLAPAAAKPAPDPQEFALEHFARKLTVRRSGSSAVADVGFAASTPQLAAKIANQVVQSYAAVRDTQQQQQLATARSWLAGQIAEQAARHSEARARAQAYQEEHKLAVNSTTSGAVQAVQALSQTSDQLSQERTTLSATLAMIGQAGDYPATPLPDEPETLTALRTELQRQQREVEKLQSIYGPDYGGAKLAQEQSALTRNQILRGTEAYGNALKARLEGVEREAATVGVQLQQAQSGLSRQSVAEMELAGLLRAAEAEAQDLAALERRQRMLDAGATVPAVDVEILSPAMPPAGAEGYGTKAYLALALFVALCVAITVVALRELFDRSARSHDQFGQVPEMVPVGNLPRTPHRDRNDLANIMQRRPPGPFADAVHGLVLSIEAASGGILPRSLMVTAAASGDGRSTVVAALSLALAATGQRVLVVDLDPDGSDPSTEAVREEGGLLRLVRSDAITGVDHLGVGPVRGVALPLRERIADILDHAARTDSIVLFDAPPVLSSTLATQLAGLAERRILVLRWGRTPRRLAELAAERLYAAGGDRVMTVMNAVDPRRHALYGFRDSLPVMPVRRRAPRGGASAFHAGE